MGEAGTDPLRKRSYRISVRKMETILSNKNIKIILQIGAVNSVNNDCDYKYYLYLCIKK